MSKKVNTTFIELRIMQHKKAVKFHKKNGLKAFENLHRELKEQDEHLLETLTGDGSRY